MIDLGVLEPRALTAAAVLLGVLLGVLGVFAWRWYRLHRERRLRAARIAGVSIGCVKDVLIPDGGGGTLHVDYLLFTPRGVLILDLRDITGNVFGSDAMTEWTVMDEARRFTFANPQAGLYDRIAAVKAIVGEAAGIPVDGRVVFTRRAKFPKGLPRLTLSEESLESEFGIADRDRADQAVDPWREAWERLRSATRPSRFSGVG
jgi:hypothetical protein